VGLLKQLGKEYQKKGDKIFHARTKSSCKIIRPNKDVMYIIGFLADGCLPKRKWKYEIEIYQKNLKLLRKIAKMFEKNFEVKPKVSSHKNAYRLRVCSKPLYLYLKELYEKVLDDLEVIRLNRHFISGFLDAEGSLIKLKTGLRVAITQSDADVLKKISKVLQKLNIHSKVYGPYEHRNSRKQMYYLHIEKENVQKFFKKIPSLRFFPVPHTMTLLR
jgi:intein/homing endonuclease